MTKSPLSPRKANIKRCHCTGDVKGGLNASLALVSSPEVACGFRYDPNHCGTERGLWLHPKESNGSIYCHCVGPIETHVLKEKHITLFKHQRVPTTYKVD